MSPSPHPGAVAGLGLGAVAAGLAAVLLHRTLSVTLEIRRYADDIATWGDTVARNTDAAGELTRLGGLSARIRAAVVPPDATP